MIKFDEIELYSEPRKKILPKIPRDVREIEMSAFDSYFLCGLLKKFQPKKIVEVGVAGGGTTVTILQCLEDIGQNYTMDSIDIRKTFSRDTSKEVGFVTKYAKENNLIANDLCGTHKFHLGKILPSVIEEIGRDIDFVILDTTHALPGEVLDFLAILPYLMKDAIVVLHDISMNQQFKNFDSHATSVLFSAVTANKFLNYLPDDIDLIYRYPNISAFQINKQTHENIENVFLTLVLRWKYFPNRNHIRAYYDIYQKHYSPELCKLFEQALKMNYLNLRTADIVQQVKIGEL